MHHQRIRFIGILCGIIYIIFMIVVIHDSILPETIQLVPSRTVVAPPLTILWINPKSTGERFYTFGGSSAPLVYDSCVRPIHYLYGLPSNHQYSDYRYILTSFPEEPDPLPLRLSNQTFIGYYAENPGLTPSYTLTSLKTKYNQSLVLSYDIRSDYWYTRLTRQYLGALPHGIDEFRRPPVPFSQKKRAAVMLYSNCRTPSRREHYLTLLMKEYPIESFGPCLNNQNSPELFNRTREEFEFKLELSSRYLFSVAMENSVTARDYVSEKIFQALLVGSVPIYYGPLNIDDFVPQHSYIDVRRYENSTVLANYLHSVTNNETLYNSYLEWRERPFPRGFNEVFRHSLDNVHCYLCQTLVDPEHRCSFDR